MKTVRRAQTIKQILPITDGLFNHMSYTFKGGLTKNSLDIMFVSNYGKRNPSPIVETIQSEYGEQMSSTELAALAGVILEMYKPKWDKLGKIYDIDYDPIHNYLDEWDDRTNEEGSIENVGENSKTIEYGKSITDTGTRRDTFHQENDLTENTSESRTDDLVKTEERNLNNSNTRTDDLTEGISSDSQSNKRDDLLEITEYGKTDTQTGNTKNNTENTLNSNQIKNDNNQVYAFNSITPSDTDASNATNENSEHRLNEETSSGTQKTESSGLDSKTNSGSQVTTDKVETSRTNTGTRTDEGLESGTVTTSDNGTVSTSGDKSSNSELDSIGVRENNLKSTTSGEDSITGGDSSTQTSKNEKDRIGRHFGNIGNLTSQKMILEEINLWKWNYMQEILNDVKEFCTLPVYLHATEWQLVDQQDE